MKTEQLSVFLENRAGRLSDVIQALAAGGINILALSLTDTSDFGILRLVTSDQDKGRQILKDRGFTVGVTRVVSVEVPNKPGGLDSVLALVSPHGINVEYMYACAGNGRDRAVMIFRFDKVEEAMKLLKANNFTILSLENLRGA